MKITFLTAAFVFGIGGPILILYFAGLILASLEAMRRVLLGGA